MKTPVQYINPQGSCPAQGNYTHVARVTAGDLLYIAGQLSIDTAGEVVGRGDFDRQFSQVFENLGQVLRGMNAGFNDVVKFTTYLVHSQDIDKFMKARLSLFPRLFASDLFPPNTLVVVDRLVKEEFLIEVEAVARAPEDR